MMHPPKPLRPQRVTPKQLDRLYSDIRNAVGMGTWPGCCNLCGWPVHGTFTGRMKAHTDARYGLVCGRCVVTPLETREGWDAIDRLRAEAGGAR